MSTDAEHRQQLADRLSELLTSVFNRAAERTRVRAHSVVIELGEQEAESFIAFLEEARQYNT